MSKGFVKVKVVVTKETALEKSRVMLEVGEPVINPDFPEAVGTEIKFRPTFKEKFKGEKPNHMKRATLDYILLKQGRVIKFLENEKYKELYLEHMPAEFLKGKRTDGSAYYLIKVNMSAKEDETHIKGFFASDNVDNYMKDFVTKHVFDENEKSYDEELVDDEDVEEIDE